MSERALRPFWMHQLVEYIIGLVLVTAAVQQPQPAVPAVLGLVVMLNTAITVGPLGAFRVLDRRLHKYTDLVVIATLLIGAAQPWFDLDNIGRLLLVSIAVVLGFVWFFTDFATKDQRKQRRADRARPASEELGQQAGRFVGDSINTAKRWKQAYEDANRGDNDE
ncbi:MAG: hypothetical protein AAGF73_12860 [Actinomycetota bacterium]